jgi:hypothetical protein
MQRQCRKSEGTKCTSAITASSSTQPGIPSTLQCSARLQRCRTPLHALALPQRHTAPACRRRQQTQPLTQCSFAAHATAAANAAVHSGTAAVQSAAAQLVQAPSGRDTAAMLFATAGAVAWVKLFDYFARHDLIERVRPAVIPCTAVMCSMHAAAINTVHPWELSADTSTALLVCGHSTTRLCATCGICMRRD